MPTHGSESARVRRPSDLGVEAILVGLLTLVASVGLIGVPAAIVGAYEDVIVLPLSLGLWCELMWLWSQGRRPRVGPRVSGWWWLAVVTLAGLVTGRNAALGGEHILADRDPGIYFNTANWVAREGGLTIGPPPAELATHDGLSTVVSGLSAAGGGTQEFQFLHFLPILQAAASWVAGDAGLASVPALIAGLAVVAVFALGTRLVRPAFAAAAAAGLALNLVFVYTARDSFSEPLTLAMLAGGLWLLTRAIEDRSWQRAMVAGLVLGSAAMARIDFALYFSGLALFLGWQYLRFDEQDRRWWLRRALPALAAGIAVPAAIGVTDGALRSTGYVSDHLAELFSLTAAACIATGVAVAVVFGWERSAALRSAVRRHGARVAVVAVVAVAALAFFVRPAVTVQRDVGLFQTQAADYAALQTAEGQAVEPGRTYDEHSARWLGWYLGLPVLAFAVGGMALASARVASGRAGTPEAMVLFVALPAIAVPLIDPGAFPDHPWVMRRFIPLAIPALLLFAVYAADRLAAAGAGRGRVRLVLIGAAAALTAFVPIRAAASVSPVHDAHPYGSSLRAMRTACERVGPDSAVIVLPPSNRVLPPAFRTVCGVPAVGATRALTPNDLRDLAGALRANGRALWLAGASATQLAEIGAQAPLTVQVTNGSYIGPTLTKRPDTTIDQGIEFLVAEVSAGPSP
jgi:4-amino-4-deoxy-L-arabinose transferase-like glycosyltransferase